MAATYRLTPSRRATNRLVRLLLRLGLMPGPTYLLGVRGRRTGRVLSTPVTLVEESGERWLVAPYGEVAWVRSARAAGQVTLSRGRQEERVAIRELAPGLIEVMALGTAVKKADWTEPATAALIPQAIIVERAALDDPLSRDDGNLPMAARTRAVAAGQNVQQAGGCLGAVIALGTLAVIMCAGILAAMLENM